MKITVRLAIAILLTGVGVFNSRPVFAQIVITEKGLPSALGTAWVTLNDTTEHAVVDVGLSGENKTWEFTQPITGVEFSQEVVALDSTPFASDFPDANWVIRYNGGLLDLIYSDIFPSIEGDVYFYHKITPGDVIILGSGFISTFLSGAVIFQPPNIILNVLPAQYQDSWITESIFSITKDTTISGIPSQMTLSVHDSAYWVIDAWGTVTIPMGTFPCLRMKSYVTMNEQVTLNQIPIKIQRTRIINYNWLTEDYGLLVRIASHTGELNDNFTDARLFTRLSSFTFGTTGSPKPSAELVPMEFKLFQNYPNPFNATTNINYQIPQAGQVILKIYDILGQEIRTLIKETREAGHFDIFWDGKNADGNEVTSGAYVYKIQLGDHTDSKRMLLIR